MKKGVIKKKKIRWTNKNQTKSRREEGGRSNRGKEEGNKETERKSE